MARGSQPLAGKSALLPIVETRSASAIGVVAAASRWVVACGHAPLPNAASLGAARGLVQEHARDEEAHVGDAVGDEGTQTRARRPVSQLEERDQHERGEAHHLPADEQEVVAAGEHEQLHAGIEDAEQDEVAEKAGIAMEVADREARDEGGDQARREHHRDREPIDQQLEREAMAIDLVEAPEVDLERERAAGEERGGRAERSDERDADADARDPRDLTLFELAAEHHERAQEERGQERRSRHRQREPADPDSGLDVRLEKRAHHSAASS
jgi:hypothetical protein